MDELLRDIRYGARSLLKTPGFAVVAIATIALGIGVNSTIFSLVNAVLFRPLAVANPDELVDIYGHTATSNSHDTHSYPNYVDYRHQTETLSGVIAYTNFFANLSIGGRSELVVGEIVSEDYFRVLGIQPTVGRAFAADEFVAVGAGPVAILNHAFWQSRFAADPGALGQPIRLNGIPYTVVGVAPEGFGGMFPAVSAQMWIPITMVEEVEPLGNQRGSGGWCHHGEPRRIQRQRHQSAHGLRSVDRGHDDDQRRDTGRIHGDADDRQLPLADHRDSGRAGNNGNALRRHTAARRRGDADPHERATAGGTAEPR